MRVERRANPALYLALGLPLMAVLASFATLGMTIAHPESELPEQYHWEGLQLDRDFSRGQRAADLHVRAQIEGLDRGGLCVLNLTMSAAAPQSLRMTIAHATLPARDVNLLFSRVSERSLGVATYSAPCASLGMGHWKLELSNFDRTWSIRQSLRGAIGRVTLDARLPSVD
jgi:hypothetical protein